MKPNSANRFDTLIWRINGVLILCVGIGAGLVLLYAGYQIYKETTGTRYVGDIINLSPEAESGESVHQGDFTPVPGRDVFISPVYGAQDFDRACYSKSTNSIRNYLFYDPAAKTARMLFDDNNRLIVDTMRLGRGLNYDGRPGTPAPVVDRFIFQTVSEDTDGNNILDGNDARDAAVSDWAGRNVHVFAHGIDRLLGAEEIAPGRIQVFMSDEGSAWAATLDPSTGELSGTVQLPKAATSADR